MILKYSSVVTWLCILSIVAAQITFSRDWTGGKRSMSSQAPVDCGQFTRLCHHFVHELKQYLTSDISGHHREERPPLYEDE